MKQCGSFVVEVELHRDGYHAAYWERDWLPGFEPDRRVTPQGRERRQQAERDAVRAIRGILKARPRLRLAAPVAVPKKKPRGP